MIVKELHIHFPGKHAVRGIHLEIKPGETLCLVGESGCGKSAFANAILRLLPSYARVSGKIEFDGLDLLSIDEEVLRTVRGKQIGMVFQEPLTALNPTMKIGKQITEGILQHEQVSRKNAHIRAVELLRKVGIADPERRMEQYPFEMSGGMRQRIVIALAIACRPKLLIADEPTTALDVTIQAQILRLLKDLQAEFGMTLLLITHDLGVVAGIADRVAVMHEGVIVECEEVGKIFYEPKHPYTKVLVDTAKM